MKRALSALVGLALACSPLFATMPLPDRVTVWLNKPGAHIVTPVPPHWLDDVRRKVKADEIRIEKERGIDSITVVKRPQERPVKLTTSVDLRPWFVEKKCLESWDAFHECMGRKRNEADEALYRRLDDAFYAKVSCQKGCEDGNFTKWRLRWPAPAYMVLEADIGEKGGFENLEAARKSLTAVNALLKKALYGARFPEDYGEGNSEYEVFAVDTVRMEGYDFAGALHRILWRLKETGRLEGITRGDIADIEKRAQAGKMVYYIPKVCTGGSYVGWYAVSNSMPIRFDNRYCPRIRVVR